MNHNNREQIAAISKQAEEDYLNKTLSIVHDNVEHYSKEISRMNEEIDEMLDHYHDNDAEVYTILCNTTTLRDHMQRALERNIKAQSKPYFGRIVFHDETFDKEESLYIGKGGIAKDTTHWMVVDWRAPAANVYYENGMGKCSYPSPDGSQIEIDLELKRTYEIEEGKLLDFFDTEVVANDDLLTKYLAKNKQAVLGEIIATIQKEQNEIIRKSPYHNLIVQGVAGSGKTTVAMHRISYILYNYPERFKPDDFYIVGSNRILLNYITGVLPDLDVYGIRQMTMEQLFVRLLYEDWDDKKYRVLPAGQMPSKSSLKGTLQWFRDLKRYCDRLEWNAISRETVYLNPKQFVEGIQDGKTGVFDRSEENCSPKDLIELLSREAVERYIRQNPHVSVQNKINMLNDRLLNKLKEQFLGKGISFTENERKAILKSYRGRYGGKIWTQSIFDMYQAFLDSQLSNGHDIDRPDTAFDVYDLAALAYLYKRIKETEVISEAHHVVIDEAQDFGMMAYSVLKFCIKDCTYTIMGDVSQNIHFGYGLNDWEELKELILSKNADTFGILKKSYRNTVEISDFATNILNHGQFSIYPVEPIIRHGSPVQLISVENQAALIQKTAKICQEWQQKGLDTIAIVCRDFQSAETAAAALKQSIEIMDSKLEETVFGSGIMILPVEYTKGLEFDAVLILNPDRKDYPVDNGHAKLLYVAATRALHELCVLHTGNLTGLIADPLPENVPPKPKAQKSASQKPALQKSALQKPALQQSASQKDVPSKPAAQKSVPKTTAITAAIKTGPPKAPPESLERESPQKKISSPLIATDSSQIRFGDMPVTEKLRPGGHAKIDLGVRWIQKQPDGLYLQSRYGILRLSPVGSAIIRVTFTRDGQPRTGTNPAIAVSHVDKTWIYKDTAKTVELMTDELFLQVDKAGGAIRYMTRDKKLLLAERCKECRQIETTITGESKAWLFLDRQKKETIFAMGKPVDNGLKLNGSARYISHMDNVNELPFLVSDQGYGILMASSGPAMCCDIPTYGSYLYAENETQIDYYFIAGKRQSTILQAYGYLCGKL